MQSHMSIYQRVQEITDKKTAFKETDNVNRSAWLVGVAYPKLSY